MVTLVSLVREHEGLKQITDSRDGEVAFRKGQQVESTGLGSLLGFMSGK